MTVGLFTGTKHYYKNETTISSVEIERINTRVSEIRNMISIDPKSIETAKQNKITSTF